MFEYENFMWFSVGKFKRHYAPLDSCKLLSPVQGFTVRTMLECATECLELSASCEELIFSSGTGLCKLAGSLGTLSSNCDGEHYLVI